MNIIDNDTGQPVGGPIDAALAAQAKSIDGEGAAPGAAAAGEPGAAAPTDDPALARDPQAEAEAKELLDFMLASLVPLYPSLEPIYTEKVQARIVIGVAPALKKYGFNLAKLFGEFGPEIGAAIVLIPLAAPTARAVAADRAAFKAEQAAAAAAAGKGGPPAGAGAEAQAGAAGAPAGGIPDPNNLASKA